jgi:chromosome segregation ATPase
MKNAAWFILTVITWSLMGYVVSCRSSGATIDGPVLAHQRQIVELEGRNQELERRITQYDDTVGNSIEQLKAIRDRSVGMEGTVDEIIDLFDEYQRRVDELSRAFDSLRTKAGDGG